MSDQCLQPASLYYTHPPSSLPTLVPCCYRAAHAPTHSPSFFGLHVFLSPHSHHIFYSTPLFIPAISPLQPEYEFHLTIFAGQINHSPFSVRASLSRISRQPTIWLRSDQSSITWYFRRNCQSTRIRVFKISKTPLPLDSSMPVAPSRHPRGRSQQGVGIHYVTIS